MPNKYTHDIPDHQKFGYKKLMEDQAI